MARPHCLPRWPSGWSSPSVLTARRCSLSRPGSTHTEQRKTVAPNAAATYAPTVHGNQARGGLPHGQRESIRGMPLGQLIRRLVNSTGRRPICSGWTYPPAIRRSGTVGTDSSDAAFALTVHTDRASPAGTSVPVGVPRGEWRMTTLHAVPVRYPRESERLRTFVFATALDLPGNYAFEVLPDKKTAACLEGREGLRRVRSGGVDRAVGTGSDLVCGTSGATGWRILDHVVDDSGRTGRTLPSRRCRRDLRCRGRSATSRRLREWLARCRSTEVDRSPSSADSRDEAIAFLVRLTSSGGRRRPWPDRSRSIGFDTPDALQRLDWDRLAGAFVAISVTREVEKTFTGVHSPQNPFRRTELSRELRGYRRFADRRSYSGSFPETTSIRKRFPQARGDSAPVTRELA